MSNRLKKLRDIMKEMGVANLFVTSLSDIYYLTGFTGSTAYLFVTNESAVFVTDGRYEEQSKREIADNCEVKIVQNYQQEIKDFAGSVSALTVTYDCMLKDYEILMDSDAEVQIDPADMIGLLRMEKDEDELEKLREMYTSAHNAFCASLPSFRAGVSEYLWAAELEKNMKLNGAKYPSFETIVASGARGAMPHGTASEKIVADGDAVVVDFGCKREYCSDVTRLVKLAPDQDVDAIADIVHTALSKAKDAVRAGVRCSEIDAVAREYISSKGYGDFFNHSLGHGVGIDVHEKPVFSFRDETLLKDNMVLTIEPGIYLPGKFGVRLEDTVVVKNDGCENLTAVFDKYVYELY